uniref:Secreted protein n=1 Tax=Parascaris univalens TaxID=6257 RepID=A0A915AIS2_PARUN
YFDFRVMRTILISFLIVVISASSESIMTDSKAFWTTTDLISVDWKMGCLTTAYCSTPQFRLTVSNHVSAESNSISWMVTQDIVQDHSRPFISYWTRGAPSDLSVACEVIGSDPKYAFQRTCDYTPVVGIFRETLLQNTSYVGRKTQMPLRLRDLDKGKMVVELRGKCFNATVTVQKHNDRCPWCVEITTTPQVVVIPKTEVPRKMTDESILEERLELVGVSILATICVLSAAAFACLLVAYLKQRSNVESRENERTYVANLMKVDSPFRNSNQIEYWDKKSKFVHWPSGSSNATISTRTASSDDASSKPSKSNDNKDTVIEIGNS